MNHRVIQIGVIGAMQRAHPALTELWLRWVGVPGLETVAFDIGRPEHGTNPATQIYMQAKPGVTATWSGFCDLLGVPEDSQERRRMPIHLDARDACHGIFWEKMKTRELDVLDGPLEWWWRLLVLRYKGIQKASATLISEVLDEHSVLNNGIVSFKNPSLSERGRTADSILTNGMYEQPTHLVVNAKTSSGSKLNSLAFSMEDAMFKGRLVSKLIDLSCARS